MKTHYTRSHIRLPRPHGPREIDTKKTKECWSPQWGNDEETALSNFTGVYYYYHYDYYYCGPPQTSTKRLRDCTHTTVDTVVAFAGLHYSTAGAAAVVFTPSRSSGGRRSSIASDGGVCGGGGRFSVCE